MAQVRSHHRRALRSVMLTRAEQHALVRTNDGLAHAVVRALSVSRASVIYEDLVQEARLGLLDAASRYNPARGRFSPYAWPFASGRAKAMLVAQHIIHIPTKLACKRLRAGERPAMHVELNEELEQPVTASEGAWWDADGSQAAAVDRRDAEERVRSRRHLLSPSQRRALDAGLKGLTATEIARKVSVPRQTVTSRLAKAILLVREEQQ